MSDAQAPKRLHYGWVVTLAFGMMIVGFYLGLVQLTAGPGYGGEYFISFMLMACAFIGGPLLLTWLLVILGLSCLPILQRWRTWLALSPALLLFGYGLVTLILNPPSPQRKFQRMFHATLPTDARNIQVAQGGVADSGGNLDFAFVCSAQSTQALIHELGLKPIETKEVALWSSTRIVPEWSINEWKGVQRFSKVEHVGRPGRAGTGFILITDASMERVFVRRSPLFDPVEVDAWDD